MIRAIILSATVAAMVTLWMDEPMPVKAAVVVPYCIIDFKAAGKDIFGNVVVGWTRGYGLCSLQDKFFQI